MKEIAPNITPEILKLIGEIDEFKGQWRVFKSLSPEKLSQLRKVATIESVGSSTRIEGSKLSDREVAQLLSQVKAESFRNRDEEEVGGYAAAMDLIFESWDVLPVTENHIRQLHRVLLQYAGKDERHRGDYKTTTNHVAAFDAEGRQVGIVFETATPFDTPFEMEKLIRWWEQARQEDRLHPLLLVGIFIVWFLAIHPFQDGNGRLSRVLTTLMLLRSGYAHVPYASLESVIEENKAAYYVALRQTQQSLKTAEPDWEPWLAFFLRCLVRQKQKLEAKIAAEQMALPELSKLSVDILDLLAGTSSITVASVGQVTGANRHTIKVALKKLVQRGLIIQRGKGRGVHYVLYS